LQRLAREGRKGHVLGKNCGDVWHLPTGRRRGSHFATFPDSLACRPILATAPRRVCMKCDRPWRRSRRAVRFLEGVPQARPFVPCGCDAPTRPGLVLDPFVGSGTTCKVAAELGRDWLGIELSAEFAELARQRVSEAA
jgi:site-specific DNA-methyltransferase (adenine-specific)